MNEFDNGFFRLSVFGHFSLSRSGDFLLALTLKTIPDEYMQEIYNYLELLQYKILYKKQLEELPKKFPNRRPGILKDPNFYMSPEFDEPLDDFKEYM